MSIQLEILSNEGNSIIVELDEVVKYNFSVNDIAEIEKRQATYTSSFKVPRTSDITEVFEGLGIVGDTSTTPYRKVNCRLYENYVPILEKGWMQVRNTEEVYYNIAVYSGVIDFFKAIEGFTIQDLDLSEIEHEKTVANVIETWNQNIDFKYRYFIGDYGGYNHYPRAGHDIVVNVDYQIPSVNVKYIWDKIFEHFGFTYSGNVFQLQDFTSLWITFPKSPELSNEQTEILVDAKKLNWTGGAVPSGQPITGYEKWTTYNFKDFTKIALNSDTWTMRVNETGNYRFIINNLEGYINYGFGGGDRDSFEFGITHNNAGFPFNKPLRSSIDGPIETPLVANVSLEEGETLNFSVFRIPERGTEIVWNVFIDEIDISILKIENTIIPQTDFVDLSIKDFFKEILWRYGLTAFTDKFSNNIHFMTLDERINDRDIEVVDWSDKYMRRTKEEYVYGYARNNWIRYQYGEENEGGTYNDGNIVVGNENLTDEKTLLTSNTYSASRFGSSFPIDDAEQSINVRQYKKFDGEVKIESDDDTGTVENIPEFESIDDRYYFVRGELVQGKWITLGSYNVFASEDRVMDFYRTNYTGIPYNDVIQNYYASFGEILNDTRIHTIELALTPIDINQLDFRKIYYFDQEANYYLLNKLQYEEGKISTAEFVRVKRTVQLGEYSDDYSNDYNN